MMASFATFGTVSGCSWLCSSLSNDAAAYAQARLTRARADHRCDSVNAQCCEPTLEPIESAQVALPPLHAPRLREHEPVLPWNPLQRADSPKQVNLPDDSPRRNERLVADLQTGMRCHHL